MLKRAVALNVLLLAVCGFLIYSAVTTELEEPDPVPPSAYDWHDRNVPTGWLLRNEE